MAWRRKKDPPDPAAGDRLLIETLGQHGADLTQARHLRAYVYFSSESDAELFGQTLRENGWEVTVSQSQTALWLALAQRELVVNTEAVAEMRTQLTVTASALDGEFDGWEASPQP